MADFDPLFSAAEQKYSLPPGILRATAQVESNFNPHAVSSAGAQGMMQMLTPTAKSLGVDPYDVPQAIDGAGRLWAENLKASGGDVDRAAMMYHGGTDPKNWGPKTHAYPGKLVSALGATPTKPRASNDPFEDALSSGGGTDPFEQALESGNEGRGSSPSPGGSAAAPLAGNVHPGVRDHAAGPDLGVGEQGSRSVPAGQRASRSAPNPEQGADRVNLSSVALDAASTVFPLARPIANALGGDDPLGKANAFVDGSLTGYTADLVHPITAALNTVLPLDKITNSNVQSIWDGKSFSDAYHQNLAIERANSEALEHAHPTAMLVGDLSGAVASPFNKIGAPIEGAGLLRNGARLIGGGALYGGVRGGSETGTAEGVGEGAAIGAVAAPVGAALGNVAGRAIGAGQRLGSTLRTMIPMSERQLAAKMIDAGASTDQVVAAHPILDPAYVEKWVQYRAAGGKAPVGFRDGPPVDAAPQQPSPQEYAAALGTQASRRGVEAISDLPPQVSADLQRLQRAGISPAEAQAEADIRYVGGEPTVANVTRSPVEQRAMFEGAKLNTPEGQALADRISGNNQALHSTVIKTVDDLGGVPAQGEAAETAANMLAQASDAERAKVARLYEVARLEHGHIPPEASEPNLADTSGLAPHYSDVPAPSPIDAPNEYDFLEPGAVRNAYGRLVNRRGPLDLVSWLRTQGGIRDDGGELSHMGITGKPRDLDFARNEGFLGKLINPRGLHLDEATERAWDHGWFNERPTVGELIEHIRSTHDGYGGTRVFHPSDAEQIANFERARDDRFFLEAQAEEMHDPRALLSEPTEKEIAGQRPPISAYEDGDRSGGFVSGKPLYDSLNDVQFRTPLTQEGKALASGFKGALDELTEGGKRGLSPQNLERLRQMVNSTYSPMGGEVNSLGGQIKGAIDKLFDELGEASPAYKAARAAHKTWAQQYDDPQGVARLIARDAKGNFLGADQWRLSENALIDRMNDKPFAQVVGQLKKIDATEALDRLKAGIVQRAYERSTNTARDHLGNPTLNGKLFQAELNKIGMPKLQALFSKQELAHLATVGRAARALNEAVPGTVNTSGTASSLINALQASPKTSSKARIAARLLAHGAASVGSPLLGNVAVELGGHTAESLSRRGANRAIEQGVREQINPGLARAVARRSNARLRNAQYRRKLGRALQKPASTAAVAGENRNAL